MREEEECLLRGVNCKSAAEDGGKSWKRDRTTDDLAANLYEIKFLAPGTGFILGNDGGEQALPKPW